jgi:hypothetical protein
VDSNTSEFHNQIIEAIQTGEVVCLFFPRIGKTLVLDMRHTIEIPPSVIVDRMVTRPLERLERLEKLRPTLPPPDELRIAPWIGSVASMEDAGITSAILERCAETGDVATVERCRQAIRTLSRLEREHLRAIVRGDMSRTVWQRERGPSH